MKNEEPSANTKNFFTPKEAAAFIGVSLTTFYKYMRKAPSKGGPPVKKFGRNFIRLPRKQFITWAGMDSEK